MLTKTFLKRNIYKYRGESRGGGVKSTGPGSAFDIITIIYYKFCSLSQKRMLMLDSMPVYSKKKSSQVKRNFI